MYVTFYTNVDDQYDLTMFPDLFVEPRFSDGWFDVLCESGLNHKGPTEIYTGIDGEVTEQSGRGDSCQR